MGQHTYLQSITDDELAELRSNPLVIADLDKSGTLEWDCCCWATLSYFSCGSAYPTPANNGPLALLFSGTETLECARFEDGIFFVVTASDVVVCSAALAELSAAFRERVEAADYYELIDEEGLYDLESMLDDDDVVGAICAELKDLQVWIQSVANRGLALVMYDVSGECLQLEPKLSD